MEVNCPVCTRPVTITNHAKSGPAQQVRCNWCGNYFFLEGESPITTGEFRQIKTQAEPDEVWELDADEEIAQASPDAASLFDDFDFDDDFDSHDESTPQPPGYSQDHQDLYPVEDLSRGSFGDTPDALPAASEPNIPDLPSASAPAAALVDQLGQGWNAMDSSIDDNVPELPDFGDIQFEDAAPAHIPGRTKKRKSATPPGGNIPVGTPLSSTSSTDAAKPIHAKPTPAPPPQRSVDDLLGDFLREDGNNEDLLLRYYIRRAKKDFGPFTEEEVHSLLEARKLTGDELSRLQQEADWVPLRTRPDFKPTIDILEKQPVRIGWEGDLEKEDLPNPIDQDDIPTLTLSELKADFQTEDIDEIITATIAARDQQAAPPATKPTLMDHLSDVRLLAGLGAFLVILVGLFWWSSQKPTKTKAKTTKGKKLRGYDLIVGDQFGEYRKLFDRLLVSFRKGQFKPSWYRVRFVYYLLDSYGDDRSIRADVEPIYAALLKRKTPPSAMVPITLARAISLKDKKTIEATLAKLPRPLPKGHAEWGYLLARANEMAGKLKEAQSIYEGLTQKQPAHVRALLGLYRIGIKNKLERKGARSLFHAFRRAPRNLPAQLLALSYAVRRNKWESHQQKIRRNIRKLVRKRQYTQESLAKWYAIVADQMWQERKTDKAIYRMEQAATLAPNSINYFLRKIQYYTWSRQYFQALLAVQKRRRIDKTNPELIKWEFRLLRLADRVHKVPGRLTTLQHQSTTLKQKYLLYFLLGDYYEAKQRTTDAMDSYLNAVKLLPNRTKHAYASLALAKMYIDRKAWKKAAALLEPLRKVSPIPRNVNMLWGEYLLKQKKVEDTLQVAKLLREQDHTHYAGYLLASRAELQRNNTKQAIGFLVRALLRHPERPSRLHLDLAELYIQQQEFTKARRSIVQYEKLLRDNKPCRFLKIKFATYEKLNICKPLLATKISQCRSLELYLHKGRCAVKNKKYNAAMDIYKKGRLKFPEVLELIEDLAKLYEKMGNTSESSRLYKIIVRKKPSQQDNVLALVRIYEKKAQYRRAWKMLWTQRALFRDSFLYNLKLGQMQTEIQQTKRALQTLNGLFAMAKGNKQKSLIYGSIGHAYWRKKKYKSALRVLNKAIKLNKRQSEHFLYKGEVELATKSYEECLTSIKTFLKLASRRHPKRNRAKLVQRVCKERNKTK